MLISDGDHVALSRRVDRADPEVVEVHQVARLIIPAGRVDVVLVIRKILILAPVRARRVGVRVEGVDRDASGSSRGVALRQSGAVLQAAILDVALEPRLGVGDLHRGRVELPIPEVKEAPGKIEAVGSGKRQVVADIVRDLADRVGVGLQLVGRDGVKADLRQCPVDRDPGLITSACRSDRVSLGSRDRVDLIADLPGIRQLVVVDAVASVVNDRPVALAVRASDCVRPELLALDGLVIIRVVLLISRGVKD